MAKTTFKNSKEALRASQEESRNIHALCQKAAAKVAQYVESKGGLDVCPKVLAFVSQKSSGPMQNYVITEIMNDPQWVRLNEKYKKEDIHPSLFKNLTNIYKYKGSLGLWHWESKEVLPSMYEDRVFKIDPQTGHEIPTSQKFSFPEVMIDTTDLSSLPKQLDKLVDFFTK